MEQIFSLIAVAAFVSLYIWHRQWLKRETLHLGEQFEEALDRFRGGGPRTPMHPSPAGDDALLRPKR